jgi:hypothetical protein
VEKDTKSKTGLTLAMLLAIREQFTQNEVHNLEVELIAAGLPFEKYQDGRMSKRLLIQHIANFIVRKEVVVVACQKKGLSMKRSGKGRKRK